MTQDMTHEELLEKTLDRVVENNKRLRPGTPMAELKDAIEASLSSLPPLEFKEFSELIANMEEESDFSQEMLTRAPEILGWDADQIIAWVEEITKKLEN
jgi:hypothetical protein